MERPAATVDRSDQYTVASIKEAVIEFESMRNNDALDPTFNVEITDSQDPLDFDLRFQRLPVALVYPIDFFPLFHRYVADRPCFFCPLASPSFIRIKSLLPFDHLFFFWSALCVVSAC